MSLRVAIVHHWFVSQGGGERVAELFCELFPQADVFTLFADRNELPPGLHGHRLTTSLLQRIPGARSRHRNFLPLYPLAVEQLDLAPYDLVLTSDSGPMKGVLINHDAVHVCYCHSPMRYLWDGYHAYAASMPAISRVAFQVAAHYVRAWDYLAAQRVTHFLANSNYVARRIRHYYGRTSTVLHPPVDTTRGHIAPATDDYYLAVGRMVPYKRTGVLIEACNRLGRRLKVVGTGPEFKRLRAMAGPTVEFLGKLENDALWQVYARCRALLFAADEDFGIVPLEAQACGRPVIAFGKGGSLETVDASDPAAGAATGIFFKEQTPASLVDAILRFEASEARFSSEHIRRRALQYDTGIFLDHMREFLTRVRPGCL